MTRRKLYRAEVRHEGLNKYRVITGTDRRVVEWKAKMQLAAWDDMWKKKLLAEQERIARERVAAKKKMEKEQAAVERQARAEQKRIEKERAEEERQTKIESAVQQTAEARQAIAELEGILAYTLRIDDTVDWEALKDFSEFDRPEPQEPQISAEPVPHDRRYRPDFGLLESLSRSRLRQKAAQAQALFEQEHDQWRENRDEAIRAYQESLAQWEREKEEFLTGQRERNEHIERRKQEYLDKSAPAVVDYCDMVLSNSKYPDSFPAEFDLDYNPEIRMLIVDYRLPSIEVLPRIREVKYIPSRDEFKELVLSESDVNKLYNSVLFQIVLRSVHELFEADQAGALDAIVFNGWVQTIDRATGQEKIVCVLSLQTTKAEFTTINLAQIDPRLCFRNLKGIGSPKLHTLVPVAPIVQIDREDKRFIQSYGVMGELEEGQNIAAMDWQDFEHLIRELFEREFVESGGEVKVTQASRDGGVDAVAFDPDPIRGGKIVIQAKRYTNTVGVSAVRDLYGTLMNEGATKGILVTTSDYGPDAHEFARGKPITLLSGANLLHLLAKHGYRARIDLQEARRMMADSERR